MIAEKLLARLNPSTCRFDIGQGGGAPELTAQDIAAAALFLASDEYAFITGAQYPVDGGMAAG